VGFLRRLKRFFGSTTPEDHAPDPAAERFADETEDEEPEYVRKVTKIRRDVLEMVFEAAKASHPHEFGGTLRAEGDTVTELILVPATIGGERHALLPLYNLPVDPSIIGTVHSHPSPYAIPSDADLSLFRYFGHTHVIVANPYRHGTWRAYDHGGREIELEIVEDSF